MHGDEKRPQVSRWDEKAAAFIPVIDDSFNLFKVLWVRVGSLIVADVFSLFPSRAVMQIACMCSTTSGGCGCTLTRICTARRSDFATRPSNSCRFALFLFLVARQFAIAGVGGSCCGGQGRHCDYAERWRTLPLGRQRWALSLVSL